MKLIPIAKTILLVIGLYLGVCWSTFEFRNPTANKAAFYTHFMDVLTFKKVVAFQIK